jgi:hypothetical protein
MGPCPLPLTPWQETHATRYSFSPVLPASAVTLVDISTMAIIEIKINIFM